MTTTTEAPLYSGPVIVTRYLGPTDHRGSRIVATHCRDSETTWRKTLHWDDALNSTDNHRAAAEALLADWPLNGCQEPWQLIGRGHDHNAYYWLAVQPWQIKPTEALFH